MNCPRCQSAITASPDPAGFLTCPSCGARLRSRPAVAASTGGGEGVPQGADRDPDPAKAPGARNPSATLPPGTPMPRIPRPAPPAARDGEPGVQAVFQRIETLIAEVKAIRSAQDEILNLLRQAPPSLASSAPPPLGEHLGFDIGDEPASAPTVPVVRARRRKTVLLVDDDEASLKASKAALEQAEVPVRSVSDGNQALAAIAQEKPDVIVMELGIGGPMPGKDVVNMIKATMEWVDVPIVLYTRLPIESQKEARTIHGADELVPKDSGPAALVARVITVFRR
jgi:CheY-like chemotaxis protein